jgi:hypothetical protein
MSAGANPNSNSGIISGGGYSSNLPFALPIIDKTT